MVKEFLQGLKRLVQHEPISLDEARREYNQAKGDFCHTSGMTWAEFEAMAWVASHQNPMEALKAFDRMCAEQGCDMTNLSYHRIRDVLQAWSTLDVSRFDAPGVIAA